MPLPRRLIASSIAVALAFVLASGIYLGIKGSSAAAAAAANRTGADSARPDVSATGAFATDTPIPVEGTRVVRDTLVISVSAAAQAEAAKRASLRAQVEGRVARVRMQENGRVRASQLLLDIDPTQYELAVAKAEAALARVEATYRELTLFDDEIRDATVRAERDRVARARSGLDEAEVALREARLQLARTRVTAPFAGRVANLSVVEGQWVSPGDSLLAVVDLDPIRVEVQVLESEIGLLAAGRGARVTFAAFPGRTFMGHIQTINPVVERTTRTARVTVTIPNTDGRILPGMYASVALEALEFPDRILVPRAAILERDRRTMLFVFDGEGDVGLSKWRYVTTGRMNDSLIEIVENSETDMVEPGEIVLTDGHYTLIHDATVRLVKDAQEEGGRPR